MPYAGINYQNVDTTSVKPYTFDLSPLIPPEDSVSSITWTLGAAPNIAYPNLDPNSAAHIGDDSISDKFVTVWLSELVALVRYRITASYVTAGGITGDIYSYVQCDPAP